MLLSRGAFSQSALLAGQYWGFKLQHKLKVTIRCCSAGLQRGTLALLIWADFLNPVSKTLNMCLITSDTRMITRPL